MVYVIYTLYILFFIHAVDFSFIFLGSSMPPTHASRFNRNQMVEDLRRLQRLSLPRKSKRLPTHHTLFKHGTYLRCLWYAIDDPESDNMIRWGDDGIGFWVDFKNPSFKRDVVDKHFYRAFSKKSFRQRMSDFGITRNPDTNTYNDAYNNLRKDDMLRSGRIIGKRAKSHPLNVSRATNKREQRKNEAAQQTADVLDDMRKTIKESHQLMQRMMAVLEKFEEKVK